MAFFPDTRVNLAENLLGNNGDTAMLVEGRDLAHGREVKNKKASTNPGASELFQHLGDLKR